MKGEDTAPVYGFLTLLTKLTVMVVPLAISSVEVIVNLDWAAVHVYLRDDD